MITLKNMKKQLLLWGLTCTIWAVSAHAEPSSPHRTKAVQKTSPCKKQIIEWPLTGQLLPIKGGSDAPVLNYGWRDITEMLNVHQLQVRHWPSAFNFVGGPERIQKRTVEALQKYGYRIEHGEYENPWDTYPIPSFDAVRGQKRYAAMWLWNGSYLMLYWGKPKSTKQSK
jgi:hypothetical protein